MLFILIEDNVFQFLTMSMTLITVCVCTSPVEEQEFSYFIKEIGNAFILFCGPAQDNMQLE